MSVGLGDLLVVERNLVILRSSSKADQGDPAYRGCLDSEAQTTEGRLTSDRFVTTVLQMCAWGLCSSAFTISKIVDIIPREPKPPRSWPTDTEELDWPRQRPISHVGCS